MINKMEKKINLFLRLDKGITEDEGNSINNGMEIFCRMFKNVNYKLYSHKDKKSYKIFTLMKKKLEIEKDLGYGKQIEVDDFSFCTLLDKDLFKKRKGFSIFFINRDLTLKDLNFVIGVASQLYYAMFSPVRFRNLDRELKDLCLKVELWHEIGHLFGAPNCKRSDLVNKLGSHDPDYEICVMRQGMNVPKDWIKFARDYKEKNIIYCDWCKKAIRKVIKEFLC